MRLLFLLACCFACLACSSQEMNQDGGDLTRGEVEYLLKKLSAEVEKEFPVLQHQLVNRYISTLGQSIVSRNPEMPPLPYEFRVLKSNEVLAFSLPGGITYISLGALRVFHLEGELAAALAHELAHQLLGHHLIHWRRKVNANRGDRNLLDFRGNWQQSFLPEGGAIHLDAAMEQEADEMGPVILYRAHFDPRVYLSYLQALRKLDLSDPQRVATLKSLHPPLTERVAWARAAVTKLPPQKDAEVSSPTFRRLKRILKAAEKRASDKKSGTKQ